jgi:hypothetical protein
MARSVVGAVLMWNVVANITDTRGRPARCGSWAWTGIEKTAYKEESHEKRGSNTSLQKTARETPSWYFSALIFWGDQTK